MKIDKTEGKWVHPQYMLLTGRVRKGLAHPRRERVLVRKAMDSIGLRYRESVAYVNRYYDGFRGGQDRVVDWLDFCVYHGKLYIILFHPKKNSGLKEREWKKWYARLRHLDEKGVDYIILKRNLSSMEYEFLIRRMIGGKYERRPSTAVPV